MHAVRLLLTLGLIALARPISAQIDSTQPSAVPRPVRVLSHVFANPSREFVRVRLESDATYRAEFNTARARLEVRPLSQGVQAPVVRAVRLAKGKGVFDIEPHVTADYEIRVLGAGDRAVRLTIDRNAAKP